MGTQTEAVIAGQSGQRRVLLTNWQSPGDIVMLTAAVRDLHKAYPGKFVTDVRTSCEPLWDNNPYITRFTEPWIDKQAAITRDAKPAVPTRRDDIMFVPCQYPLVQRSNQYPGHFVGAFHDELARVLRVEIPVTEFKGDIHLSDAERGWMSQIAEMGVYDRFWIINSGGKWDYTAKWPNVKVLQDVVHHYMGKVVFVQAGDKGNWQPPLSNCINVIGQTDIRQLIRLIYHSTGVITPVNGIMHLAAAVPFPHGGGTSRPCVVIAGAREPTHWEAYPTHRFLSTQGALPCCNPSACWKSRCTPVGDKDGKDADPCTNYVEYDAPRCETARQQPEKIRIPKCIDMISADDVIRAIDSYYTGGVLPK